MTRLNLLRGLVATLVLVGCGSVPSKQTDSSFGSSISIVRTNIDPTTTAVSTTDQGVAATTTSAISNTKRRLAVKAQLPLGFLYTGDLTLDSSDTSIWFWATSDVEARVFRLDSAGSLRSWLIGTSDADRLPGSPAVLSVSNGSAFLVENSSMYTIRLADDSIFRQDLGELPPSKLGALTGPSPSFNPLSAVAITPTWVVVGRARGNVIQFAARGAPEKFGSLDLGAQFIPLSILGSRDPDSVIVAVANLDTQIANTVLVVNLRTGGVVPISVFDSTGVVALDDGSYMLGTSQRELMSPVAEVSRPSWSFSVGATDVSVAGALPKTPVFASQDRFRYWDGTQIIEISYPDTGPCGPPSLPRGVAAGGTPMCATRPTGDLVDVANKLLWATFASAAGEVNVYETEL